MNGSINEEMEGIEIIVVNVSSHPLVCSTVNKKALDICGGLLYLGLKMKRFVECSDEKEKSL